MRIALTGGIGCGKSTVVPFFKEFGWCVADADKICHDIYEAKQDTLIPTMKERWGDSVVVNGVLDRAAIARIVFSNENELQWLNSIFHPLVKSRAEEIFEGHEYCLFDVPLLYEAGWESGYDCVVSVWCSKDIQTQRLLDRGMTIDDAEMRIGAQMSADEKLERADFALLNQGTVEQLQLQILKLDNHIKEYTNDI